LGAESEPEIREQIDLALEAEKEGRVLSDARHVRHQSKSAD
jgi:hypothetical protein